MFLHGNSEEDIHREPVSENQEENLNPQEEG
jgi:hypothetical protein